METVFKQHKAHGTRQVLHTPEINIAASLFHYEKLHRISNNSLTLIICCKKIITIYTLFFNILPDKLSSFMSRSIASEILVLGIIFTCHGSYCEFAALICYFLYSLFSLVIKIRFIYSPPFYLPLKLSLNAYFCQLSNREIIDTSHGCVNVLY